MKYNLEYFIAKFESIPEYKWLCGEFSDEYGECKCALGHCGVRQETDTPEGDYLLELTDFDIAEVNDGVRGYDTLGSTPKQRVVNYLKSLRK